MSQDLQAEVAELRERLIELERLVRPHPVRTWRAVANILGVSEDTIARRRRERGDTSPPNFRSADGVWDWWQDLLVPPAPTRRRGPAKPRRQALDVKALVEELTRD